MSAVVESNMTAKELGDRIHLEMYKKKINQTQLAKLTGRNRSMLSRYISGDVKMGFDILIEIADALDVSIDRLLGREKYYITTQQKKEAFALDHEQAYGKIVYRKDNKLYDIDEDELTQIRLGRIEGMVEKIIEKLDHE